MNSINHIPVAGRASYYLPFFEIQIWQIKKNAGIISRVRLSNSSNEIFLVVLVIHGLTSVVSTVSGYYLLGGVFAIY